MISESSNSCASIEALEANLDFNDSTAFDVAISTHFLLYDLTRCFIFTLTPDSSVIASLKSFIFPKLKLTRISSGG